MLIDNKDGRYSGLPELFNVDQGFVDVQAERLLYDNGEMSREEARELAIIAAAALVFPVETIAEPAPVIEPVTEPVVAPVEVPAPVEEVTPDTAITEEDLFGDPHV